MCAARAAKKTETVSYDDVPYESYAYPHTHPENLAVVGSLFGMTPAPIETAKVLEIGSASGGNIMPLAMRYPKAKFHGIDLSSIQIEQGKQAIKANGLKNITLEQMDLMKFDLEKHKGAYDYIICHGVFSWVPDVVRARILELARACLSPQGLALVSYNTLPGWNAVRSLREMMIYHTNRFTTPAEKVSQAKALLKFLAENVADARSSYKSVIQDELNLLNGTNDSYLFHDHLEGNNNQFYFHQFAEMADKAGLSYVGDSSLPSMFVGNLPQAAMETLKAVNDIVGQEQYMDFVNNRRFRNTILCHKENILKRNLDDVQILNYRLTAEMQPEAGKVAAPINFTMPSGAFFTANDKISATLYLAMTSFGSVPTSVDQIIAKAIEMDGTLTAEQLKGALASTGLKLALHGYITLHLQDVPSVSTLSEKPEVFAWARYQAAQPNCTRITNLRMNMISTDAPGALIVTLLDGTRDRGQVIDAVVEAVKNGTLNMQHNGQPVTDDKQIREFITPVVDNLLGVLLQQHLLVA